MKEENISAILQAEIDKINETEVSTPEILIPQIISLMRTYSMEKNSMEIGVMFLVGNDGRFTRVPLPLSVIHGGDLGEMLLKNFIDSVKKVTTVNSLLEINFGTGLVSKFKKEDEAEADKIMTTIKKDLESANSKEEFLASRNDFQDYFIVHILKENKMELQLYDIIKSFDKEDNKNYMVISNTPMITEELEYDGKQRINYLK